MHEEYSDSKQLGIFLSVARSYASFLQSVDNQIRYFRLQQIYTKIRHLCNNLLYLRAF